MNKGSAFNQKQIFMNSLKVGNLTINSRFFLKKLIKKNQSQYVFEGINIENCSYVTIYLRNNNSQFKSKKRLKIKQELRVKISPCVIWLGEEKIDKNNFQIQVHDRYGPSFKIMFSYIFSQQNKRIIDKDFFHLMYQLIRLVQRYSTSGWVFRELNLENLTFDLNPLKCEIYLLNTFSMVRRNQQCPAINTKFCSIAAHLGLNASVKDDLQSICYILAYIYCGGFFLQKSSNYLESKNSMDFEKLNLPITFLNFFYYIKNLNFNDEINYFYWKNQIIQIIGKENISKPFDWMTSQNKQPTNFQEEEANLKKFSYNSQIQDEITNNQIQLLEQKLAKQMKISTTINYN